ncbi:hypothetical protein COL5a_001709 [Colletotrichum fioriniae]|uniref:uncharacterized protein n=1 Tax=Colletotrichum fioriniae TaxID=710243 RepID=UPI0023000D3A|nr:uncharacterized protein COL516b_002788 [Colletotrichum fioriniae]KAJ0309542.1 hypothetical protein COL516b_002788 [Colletotrichum fioriniae]KAJ0332980.1 hypothetical protein COL5a_001709 [Colletotrichum fioriniae]KAJ3946665.1 hypothetical protein N0V96_003038 [Colletotrichum fioriniae]
MASKNRTASDTHDDLAPQPCKKKTRVHSPDKTSNVNTGISNDTRSPAKADEITLPRQMKDHPKQGYKRDDSNIPENRGQLEFTTSGSSKPNNEILPSIVDDVAYDADDESDIKFINAETYYQFERAQRMMMYRCNQVEIDLGHQSPSTEASGSSMEWEPLQSRLETIPEEDSELSSSSVADEWVWPERVDISEGLDFHFN